MLKALLVVFLLIFAGCATTVEQQDLSVRCPNGGPFYKSDYAPLEFPNELFAEYICKKCKFDFDDLSGDGVNDIMWSIYFDDTGTEEAWWVLRIFEPDGSKATTWAFLKNIDGRAKIIWENKGLKKMEREWLRGVVQLMNKELAAR
jgi:hypothetical protein